MVVKLAIDPEALLDYADLSPRAMKNQHKRLIMLWEKHGVLVDPGRGADSITSKFDDEKLRKVRTIWTDAWKAKGRCRRLKPQLDERLVWDSISSPSDLAAHENLIDLAIVSELLGTAYLDIADNDDTYGTYCGAVEALLSLYPEESDAFSKLAKIENDKIIHANQNVKAVWNSRFQWLAQKSMEIVMIDRYALSESNVEGLFEILKLVNQDNPNAEVVIYASNPTTLRDSSIREHQVEDFVRNHMEEIGNRLSVVKFILVTDYRMTRERYIRFGECAFSVGHGLAEVFRAQHAIRDMPCVLDTKTTGFLKAMRREIDRLLMQNCWLLSFAGTSLIESNKSFNAVD